MVNIIIVNTMMVKLVLSNILVVNNIGMSLLMVYISVANTILINKVFMNITVTKQWNICIVLGIKEISKITKC